MEETDFFKFKSYREFLEARYNLLKETKPGFSSRNFAKQAGIASHGYFKLVISGKRNLSLDYAEKFAKGLKLSDIDKSCLVTSIAIENNSKESEKFSLLKKLNHLKKISNSSDPLKMDHIRILSDLQNLKLYLLAQSNKFTYEPSWINKFFALKEDLIPLEDRIKELLSSGLWKKEGKTVETRAPKVHSGGRLKELHLLNTHKSFINKMKESLINQGPDKRIVGARSFLCKPDKLPEIEKRIEEFKTQIEAEFEDLDSTHVYTFHTGFFEL